MIKPILLIFDAPVTWDKIARAQRSMGAVLFQQLIPIIVLSVAGEIAGRMYLRPPHGAAQAAAFPNLMAAYGAAQVIFSFLLVLIGAQLIKAVAETFHARHTFTQCFTVAAYGLGPFFLVRWLDVIPGMNVWVTFGIGIVLTISTLYYGLPCVLKPDPPNAFGLFFMSGLLLLMVGGLARLITWLVLQGRIHVL